jgi:transposase
VTAPMPQPRPGAPWPSPLPPPTVACCELAAGGDECFCADEFAEVLAAFASPLVLALNGGEWAWTR